MRAKKVILHTSREWDPETDSILETLIDDGVMLFCTVGVDCERWHDVMDEILVIREIDENLPADMITTWHNDESLEEVVEFARNFTVEGTNQNDLEIIEI